MDTLKGKKIVLVSTVPYFMLSQLSSKIQYFSSLGMQVTVITSLGEELQQLPKGENIRVITVDIPRKLEIWGDVKAVFGLYQVFRQEKFDILHSFTPKAGLLCAIAASLSKIQWRFHTFTGQAWVTQKGFMRSIMRLSDRLIIRLMSYCYADSPSQRSFLVKEGIGSEHSIGVMGYGSLGGVDTHRFSPACLSEDEKHKQKEKLGIAESSCIYVYVGRITFDKGVNELLEAFKKVQNVNGGTSLLLVGPVDDDGHELYERAMKQKNVHYLGYQNNVEQFFAVSDVLCLPSYREGFGTVVVEAAAMEVPCVGTDIPGLIDAIDDSVTGVLVPVNDIESLSKAMAFLAEDKKGRERMGKAARRRVINKFDVEFINLIWAKEYAHWISS